MASFLVKYQFTNPKTKATNVNGTTVNASSVSEAKQNFKENHIDNENKKYKILSVVKQG
jgi:tRNA/tmRNA/rRNA uracil-C5-methylase (TrmA/RlmC/RlmD family)